MCCPGYEANETVLMRWLVVYLLSHIQHFLNPTDCSLPDSSVYGISQGKNTGVSCHSLHQGIFPAQELNWHLLLVAQRLKHLPPIQETRVGSLGGEDPLEKEMATHSSVLAWRIPWTETPGRLQSTGSQRVGHDWATSLSFFFFPIKGGLPLYHLTTESPGIPNWWWKHELFQPLWKTV